VYLYGSLDTRATQFNRSFGMAWGIGGWLVFSYLAKLEPALLEGFKQRVAAELKTTFASHYTRQVSLAQALSLQEIAVYGKRATGEKYLIVPART
jgi:NADPH2:quinone reductase